MVSLLTPMSTSDRDEMLDKGWLETDLSNLGKHDAYQWQAGELEQGSAVEIDSEQRIIIAERWVERNI